MRDGAGEEAREIEPSGEVEMMAEVEAKGESDEERGERGVEPDRDRRPLGGVASPDGWEVEERYSDPEAYEYGSGESRGVVAAERRRGPSSSNGSFPCACCVPSRGRRGGRDVRGAVRNGFGLDEVVAGCGVA